MIQSYVSGAIASTILKSGGLKSRPTPVYKNLRYKADGLFARAITSESKELEDNLYSLGMIATRQSNLPAHRGTLLGSSWKF